MISLIVSIIILLIGIGCIIWCITVRPSNVTIRNLSYISAYCFMFALVISIGSLYCGRSIYKQKDMLIKKHITEIVLNNEVSYDTIKEAEKYNRDVQYGNNYWCRFNIEDRSEYIINIDSYLEQSKQDNNGDD